MCNRHFTGRNDIITLPDKEELLLSWGEGWVTIPIINKPLKLIIYKAIL